MKIFVILAAGAQAWTCGDWDPQPCDVEKWLEDNLPATANESFEFISNNWDQFVHAIPSVNRKVLRLVFNAYDSDGDFVLEESPFTFDESCDYCGEFWDICDTDNSGYLNIDEFVYFMNWYCDVYARLIIKVRT